MKRIFLTIITMFLFSAFADEYTIVKISGRASSRKGSVSVGQTLKDSDYIKISGERDYIELSDDKIIKGPAEGTVKKLIQNNERKK